MENSEIYLGMRNMAATTKAEDIGIVTSDDTQVFAAIADMKVESGIATLACMFDGTVSLYYSNGKVDIGLGQQDTVKKAAMSFLFSAGQCLPAMKRVDTTAPPSPEFMDVYLASSGGLYFTRMQRQDNMKEHQFLNFLIQNILNAIRQSNQ